MSYEHIDDFVEADARPDTTRARPTKFESITAHKNYREPQKLKAIVPTPIPAAMKRPIYLCPELGKTCHRPGAYDAYALPSLYDGVLKPYRFSDETPAI